MDILRAEHITKQYDGRTIIEDISIHLGRGELVSLLGLSGSGKTTLFHVLSGLTVPEEGRVVLIRGENTRDGGENGADLREENARDGGENGADLREENIRHAGERQPDLREEDITGRPGRISYMLQKDLLLEHKRVIDNVALPLILAGMKKKEAREKADPLFREFSLEGTQMLYPAQLSGGMRQRAALLRTYLSSVRDGGGAGGAALLDEPFSALDSITKGQIHSWYLEVMEKIRLSTLFITHDVDEAVYLSDRIYIMTGSPGRIRDEISITQPRQERAEFTLSPEFLAYKKKILEILKNQ